MKLVLVIPSLGGGGAERVMSALANAWAVRGDTVTLVTLARQDDRYPLNAAIRRVALGVKRRSSNPLTALARNGHRVRALAHVLRDAAPDAVVSFTTRTNVLVLLAAGRRSRCVIVSERAALGPCPVGAVWRALRRLLYRRAGAVVAQTRRGADALAARVGRAVEVIPNPLSAGFGALGPAAHRERAPFTLLAVGRLAPEKGFDTLLEAFARIAGTHPDWNLTIAGEGPLRNALTQTIAARDLAGRVVLPGFTRDVRATLRAADLFVLSSRFEGFPNALLEAMAEGLACVSFDCETGPRELITHAHNGWLVAPGDAAALAAALSTLMRDGNLRARLGARARAVCGVYALPEVMRQWNHLLALACAPTRARSAPFTADAK
ncbi:MAG TPA: glycosyltransferase [Rhodanobacteraceae bacterium]|nr:glycosyltransferase [Rhodanobacteraceae bacterium]